MARYEALRARAMAGDDHASRAGLELRTRGLAAWLLVGGAGDEDRAPVRAFATPRAGPRSTRDEMTSLLATMALECLPEVHP